MEKRDKSPENLREEYIGLSPARRAELAVSRMVGANGTANRLITAVSATEALARALVLENLECKSLQDSKPGKQGYPKGKVELYEKVRMLSAKELLTRITGWARGGTPENWFGAEAWADFLTAVEFRNVLVHESLPIEDGLGERLAKAVEEIFIFLRNTLAGGWGTLRPEELEPQS